MAYVDAIAGRVGINVTRALQDYGVDGTFHPVKDTIAGRTETGFTLQYQLKATVNWEVDGHSIVYDMEAAAFNKMALRDPAAVPLVLILLCLPTLEISWLRQNERALLLARSCYWYWQAPGDPTANSSSKRVRIPRSNHLNAAGLTALLNSAEAYQRGEQDYV